MKPYDLPLSDSEVIDQYNLMCPLTIIRCARLALFARLVNKRPKSIVEVLSVASQVCSTGWCSDVVKDLVWLSIDSSGPVQNHHSWLINYYHDMCELPEGILTKHVKKFCQLPFANLAEQWAITRTLVSMNSMSQCGVCNMVFKSHQSKTLHEFKAHGVKDPVRCYAPTTTCVCCMRNFWTRPRIVNHLKKSSFCRLNLQMRFAPFITSEECDHLEDIERPDLNVFTASGKRMHFANRAPCMRMPGPLIHALPP